jgi:hypothetical protein
LLLHLPRLSYVRIHSLFSLGRWPLLHNVLTLIFRILMEDRIIRFMIFSTQACLLALLTGSLLPKHNCCFRPWSLVPLLNFDCVHYLIPNIRPLGAPHTTLPLFCHFNWFQYPAACCWPPDRSFSAPTASIVASSLGTSDAPLLFLFLLDMRPGLPGRTPSPPDLS